ncbi:MAG: ABC transporter ATP-binding protein [Candidatus Eiseniibacteriota bacterium]
MVKQQSEYCIYVENLMKKFGKNILAVNDISFSVKYGKVFGFLGPNGAGKTTTIKLLTTLIPPSGGIAYVFGNDITKNGLEIRKRIGVVSQPPSYESNLTVNDALDLYGLLWKVRGEKRAEKLKEILRVFDLVSIKNTKNGELSVGQRRRVQVAREFMHDMDLLFLDEPTVGLDPSARRSLLDFIKAQVRSGLTVFFTTHIMEEAEYLCDEIAIINGGKIIAFDTPKGLKQKYSVSKNIEVRFKTTAAKVVVDMIESIIDKTRAEVVGPYELIIKADNPQEAIIKLIQLLTKMEIEIDSISVNPPSLEDVFLTIVNDSKTKQS